MKKIANILQAMPGVFGVVIWALLWYFIVSISPRSEPVPCSTDDDCCRKNPKICLEDNPRLYNEMFGVIMAEDSTLVHKDYYK